MLRHGWIGLPYIKFVPGSSNQEEKLFFHDTCIFIVRSYNANLIPPSLPPPHLLPLPPVGSQSVNMQVTDTGRSIVEQDIPGESTALDEVTVVLLCCARTGTARHSGTTPRRNRTRTKHLRTRQRKSNTLIDTICFFFFYSL